MRRSTMSRLFPEEWILVALCLLLPAPLLGQVYLEGGASFATGDDLYTRKTNEGALSAGLAWTTGRLTLRASLPYFVRDTSALTPRAESALPDDDSLLETLGGREGSVGDPFLHLFARVVTNPRSTVGLGLSVKAPVVEAGDFGTGGWDVGWGISLSRVVHSSTLIGFDASFWHLSDSEELDLQDLFMGTVTVARGLGRQWSLSASLSGSRSVVAGYAAPWWCSILLGRLVSAGSWGLAVTVGLTDTAPDLGLGVVWRLRLTEPG